MNLHDLEKIYNEVIETYKKDKTVSNIQINLIFNNAIYEKRTSVINVDFRDKKIENKTYKKLEKNPYVKPQIKENNGKYSF
jgi:hypothetical protein